MKEIITVDKITASGCQLDTAVYLFANDICEISSITLAYSGWKIARDLAIKKGALTTCERITLDNNISYSEVDKIFSYFKHANEDSETLQQFPKGYAEGLLACAIEDFRMLNETSKSMDLFICWFLANNNFSENSFDNATEKEKIIFRNSKELFSRIKFSNVENRKKLLLDELDKIL